jgi:hypothetical protein
MDGVKPLRNSDSLHATQCNELQRDELDIPLNTLEGQIMLGARDLIAEEAFTEVGECQS